MWFISKLRQESLTLVKFLVPLLHLYYLPFDRRLDHQSTNGHELFSTCGLYLLMGYSVCRWCLHREEVAKFLLVHFLGQQIGVACGKSIRLTMRATREKKPTKYSPSKENGSTSLRSRDFPWKMKRVFWLGVEETTIKMGSCVKIWK